jgi:hypothetical protein
LIISSNIQQIYREKQLLNLMKVAPLAMSVAQENLRTCERNLPTWEGDCNETRTARCGPMLTHAHLGTPLSNPIKSEFVYSIRFLNHGIVDNEVVQFRKKIGLVSQEFMVLVVLQYCSVMLWFVKV